MRRSHPVLGNPYVAMIVLMIYGFALTSFSGISGAVLNILGAGEEVASDVWSIIIVLLGILMLVIHKAWFKPEYRGNVRTYFLKDRSIMICILAFLAIDVLRMVVEYIVYGCTEFSFGVILTALSAGCTEEVICRGLIISTMMRKFKDKGIYWPALVFPAILFGISHAVLSANGASMESTILTVISATFAGLFFAAVYLRTGSILPTIILHFLHDFMAMMVNSDSTVSETLDHVLYGVLLVTLIFLTGALLKGHKEDILAVWKERWGGEDYIER